MFHTFYVVEKYILDTHISVAHIQELTELLINSVRKMKESYRIMDKYYFKKYAYK